MMMFFYIVSSVFILIIFRYFIALVVSIPVLWCLSFISKKRSLGVVAGTPVGVGNRKSYIHIVVELFLSYKDRCCLYWVSRLYSNTIRRWFYKYIFLVDISEKVVIYSGVEIRKPVTLRIGKGSIIGNGAILDARAGIEIGSNVDISSNVSIWTMQHDYRDEFFRCTPDHFGPVKICDRAWIGPNSIILHDVTIGEGAVVAAGAVVTKDVPPFTLVGGIPAKKIGVRPQNLSYEFNGNHVHFL